MNARRETDKASTGQPSGCPRSDYRFIVDLVAPGSRVLDLGCGEGDLLATLIREKQVQAEGIELAEECIQACVAQGLTNVHHGDLDEGLADHADQSVDYVLLTNTLQVLHRPRALLQEMARVGRRCLITLPNFAHWSARLQLGLLGRMPKTARLPHEWYDTPNIHLTTLADFRELVRDAGLTLEREIPLVTWGEGRCRVVRFLPNLRADAAIFEITGPPRP
jgi:methionine biosynthesis protein MetW